MTSVSTNEPFYTVENQREVVITRSVITAAGRGNVVTGTVDLIREECVLEGVESAEGGNDHSAGGSLQAEIKESRISLS